MNMLSQHLFTIMWALWLAYWTYTARNTKRTLRQESQSSRVGHMGPLLLAACLLAWPGVHLSGLGARFVSADVDLFWLGAALCAIGLGFTAWARIYIGSNWSGVVTIKEQHELITSGPYALVRHPIYTGLLLAFLGSALARAEWRGMLALVMVFLALWRKLCLEERWMEQTFGARYTVYQRRVSALIPFLL
jgi:protein-S-isoprenylcysteine O-methyltransferase Ste14